MNAYRCCIEIELDECGFHAIVADEGNEVLYITDSFNTPEDAENAARRWIDRQDRLSA